MRTKGEFRALLVLLGDDTDKVVTVAWDTLLQERDAAVPYLDEATRSDDPRLRGRARMLLEEVRVAKFEDEWRNYTALPDDDMDLERGCLLLSKLAGSVDEKAIAQFLDAIGGMVRAHMVAVGGVQALGEVLFDNLGFRGGDFDTADHHYLTKVLECRAGIPISLATIYVLVGRRIGLPVSGVAMPGHYLARMELPDGPCFVDCYNRGQLYTYDTLANLLTSRGIPFSEQYLSPTTVRFTLFRMLNNLEQVYKDADDGRMQDVITRWRKPLGLR